MFEILRDGWHTIATQPVGRLNAIAMQPMANPGVIGEDAGQMLAQYRAGLEAQIALLRQLEAVASTQRTVSESRDFERLAIESDRRDSLTRSLVEIEQGLAAGLRGLGASRQSVARLEGLSEVIALRRTTANLIARILATDQLSLQSLANAELAHRSPWPASNGEKRLAVSKDPTPTASAPPSSTASVGRREMLNVECNAPTFCIWRCARFGSQISQRAPRSLGSASQRRVQGFSAQ